MIAINNVSKIYSLGATTLNALTDVTLNIQKGEFVALTGASGSGKSTLLSLLGCLDRPSGGQILFDGEDLNGLSSDGRAQLRLERMGFIFQTFNLLPVLTAYENVEYVLHLQRVPSDVRHQRVVSLLRETGLERFAQQRPAQLSGGQRQRVAIARALATSPILLLADEPTANLDRQTGFEIIQLLKDLHRQKKNTLILATHDPHIMKEAGRIIELVDGRVVKDQS